MSANLLWGVDLGGTKIECAVIEKDTMNVLARERIATEQENGYGHILNQIETLLGDVSRELKVKPLRAGFGTPGTIDVQTGLLKNSNTVCLNGKPLKIDLENKLKIPVVISNDANCFALAETKMGIVTDLDIAVEVVFGVIMGTGVGGGIVVNGHVLNGHHGIAGEWGHNFLDDSAGPCYCGRTGCVEKVISGKALENYYEKLTTKRLSLPDIVKKTKSDTYARQTLDRLHNMFGKAIANVINILDPDVIIIGGGVGNIESLHTEGKKKILSYLFNPVLNTKILKPKLGDSAGVFGAALLVDF